MVKIPRYLTLVCLVIRSCLWYVRPQNSINFEYLLWRRLMTKEAENTRDNQSVDTMTHLDFFGAHSFKQMAQKLMAVMLLVASEMWCPVVWTTIISQHRRGRDLDCILLLGYFTCSHLSWITMQYLPVHNVQCSNTLFLQRVFLPEPGKWHWRTMTTQNKCANA